MAQIFHICIGNIYIKFRLSTTVTVWITSGRTESRTDGRSTVHNASFHRRTA